MNKKVKVKLISLVSMLTISSFVFVGCGTSKTTSTGNSKNTNQSTVEKSKNKSTVQKVSTKDKNLNSTQTQSNYSISNFKVGLDKLVSQKTITPSQESILLNLFNKKEITSANFETQLNNLVTNKTITPSQKSIILRTFKSNQASKVTTNTNKVKQNNKKSV